MQQSAAELPGPIDRGQSCWWAMQGRAKRPLRQCNQRQRAGCGQTLSRPESHSKWRTIFEALAWLG